MSSVGTNAEWWLARIRLQSAPYARRRWVAVLAIIGWVLAYVLIAWEAFLHPSYSLLVVLVAILTSEGFLTTSIQIGRWMGNAGTQYFDAARRVVGKEFAANGASGIADRLGNVLRTYKGCLAETYSGLLGRKLMDSNCTVEKLCQSLAEVCASHPGPEGL